MWGNDRGRAHDHNEGVERDQRSQLDRSFGPVSEFVGGHHVRPAGQPRYYSVRFMTPHLLPIRTFYRCISVTEYVDAN